MGEIVVAAYKPKPGCEAALLALTLEHVPYLRTLGLLTDRPHLVMRAKNGTILEVFEWQDGGTARAHEMPEVHALWEKYGAVCEYVPLRTVAEAGELFAMFEPLDF
jgi:hypothetical protein